MKDISVSIREKLKNIAKRDNVDFNSVLTRYGLERLLYRIGKSDYSNQFLLKGALLFTLWYDIPHRPTRDMDLLGFGNNDLAYLKKIFSEICVISESDGIVFDIESIAAYTIKKDFEYVGARVELFAELSKARIKIQVDVGYGDAVTPGPVESDYPTLINDLPAPKINTYPIYTVIAEKLHAIVKFGMVNSRLKDYLDLFVLLKEENIEANILAEAIQATFTRRGTEIPEYLPIGLTDEFAEDQSRQSIWQAFCSKNDLELLPLSEIVSVIRDDFQLVVKLLKV